jgi:hypothetical protein
VDVRTWQPVDAATRTLIEEEAAGFPIPGTKVTVRITTPTLMS